MFESDARENNQWWLLVCRQWAAPQPKRVRANPIAAYTNARQALPWHAFSFQLAFFRWEGYMGSQGAAKQTP